MPHPIVMPKPGQMTEECTLILWRKAEGDLVHKGDVLFEIETDKSAMEVETWDEGTLLRQVVAEGQTVPVNAVCAWIGEPGEAIPDTDLTFPEPLEVSAPAGDALNGVEPDAPATTVAAGPAVAAAAPGPVPGGSEERIRISPRASRLAALAGLDPRDITGTGPNGRITERDVEARIAARTAADAAPIETAPAPDATAPAARPVGPAPSPSTPAAGHAPAPPPASAAAGGDEAVVVREPMSRMRRVIAERLTHSWTSTPHFSVTIAVDMQRLMTLRATLKSEGTNLSVTDFVLAATAQTLVEFPDVNTRVEGTELVRQRHVHLGLAVAVTGGLLVPVIRDADLLSIPAIHDRAQQLISGAREGTLKPGELSGSTFTVSNLGMLGVEAFTAIINPGDGAILAVAAAIPTPVVVGDGIAIRPIMRLTLSADHRVVDGETGARFLGALRRRLEASDELRAHVLSD
jgi:pyruvate dehydrogenase E2 component (dihydrolipoamide acetyltransferase)